MEQIDSSNFQIKESLMIRKFKVDEWTEEQISSGEAEPFEILTVEDGVVINRWVRDEHGTD